ncbi:hypothetical protein FRC06_009568, partial [Ceratobasidium sp. 370]
MATSLTQDLSPEQDADILLLGCGDPRNILYTAYADVTSKARNILLFALVGEKEPMESLWDIFFNFNISKRASSRLGDIASQLFQAATTIENWRQSKWGSYIKMVDLQTLATLHRHWKLYADFANLPSARIDKLRREHSQLSKRWSTMHANNISVGRSAGILWHQAVTPMAKLFQKYWETGTTFTSSDDIKAATELNPTFVYSMSGEMFNPHYATFPQGFHFVPAFAPVASDPTGPAAPGNNNIMDVAKRQFTA